MRNWLLFDKDVSKLHKFNIVWPGLWFALEVFFTLTDPTHSWVYPVFMVLFAMLMLWGIYQAKEVREQKRATRAFQTRLDQAISGLTPVEVKQEDQK